MAERVGFLKADFRNFNEIGPQATKGNRLCDFGFANVFADLRTFAFSCGVFRVDVTRNVTHVGASEFRDEQGLTKMACETA
jgi:hypothetical protein